MSSVFSKLIDKTSQRCGIQQETLTRGVVGAFAAAYVIRLSYPYVSKQVKRAIDSLKDGAVSKRTRQSGTVGLDMVFLRQLLLLLRIMVPSWKSREAGLLAGATLTLLARTFLSVYVATLEGQIVKRIVLRDVKGFFFMLFRWFAIAFPATFVNSAIRYLEGLLALSFRYNIYNIILSLEWQIY